MKTIKFIISIIICALFFASCVEKNDSTYKFDSSKYVYAIPEVEVTEDYVIGAIYQQIDSGYWFNKSDTARLGTHQYTGTPTLGKPGDIYPYSMSKDFKENNSTIMRQQLQYAADAGVDFFIFGWNGRSSDTLILNYLNSRKSIAKAPNIVIKYDMGHLFSGTGRLDKPKPTDKLDDDKYLDRMLKELDSLNNDLMSKEHYQKNNGKPLLLLNFYGDGRVKSFSYIISRVREKFNFWIVGEVVMGWSYGQPELFKDTIRSLDAMYENKMVTGRFDQFNVIDGVRVYYSYIDYQYAYWQKFMQQYGNKSNGTAEFIPMVMPAYDNYSPNNKDYRLERYTKDDVYLNTVPDKAKGEEEQFYRIYANVGKRNVGDSRIIIINSWNDYKDGTSIEPTVEGLPGGYGTRYLQYTRKYFKVPK